MRKPSVLVLSQTYLPGYKGGGPARSISNAVEALGNELDFYIVTSDRDVGETSPYRDIAPYTWIQVGKAQVTYMPPGIGSMWKLLRLLINKRTDLLYLNSFFSRKYSMFPLALWRLGLLRANVLLSPRGEFSNGALKIKSWRKRLYISLLKVSSLYRGVVWHASSEYEEHDIRSAFLNAITVAVASPMAPIQGSCQEKLRIVKAPDLPARTRVEVAPLTIIRRKPAGEIRLVFLARICRIKNLRGAISMLSGLPGRVQFSIYGPVEDAAYWRACQAMIARLPSNVQVSYEGAVPHEQTQEILYQNDVFLFPTLGENYGHVILEALLAGCPVVISDQTPWRNLQGRGAGWDLAVDDWRGFQHAIQSCIEMDPDKFEEFSSRALEFGEQQLRDPKSLEQNRRLFLELLPDALWCDSNGG